MLTRLMAAGIYATFVCPARLSTGGERKAGVGGSVLEGMFSKK